MPQVSKYPISKDIAGRMFEIFVKTLIKVKNHKEASNFTYDLFTPVEKIMFAKRIAIAFLLRQNYQYREISKLLRVSLATIASVNITLKLGKGGYDTILDKIVKEEKLDEFFGKIAGKLFSVGKLQTKGSAWRYLAHELQNAKTKRKAF